MVGAQIAADRLGPGRTGRGGRVANLGDVGGRRADGDRPCRRARTALALWAAVLTLTAGCSSGQDGAQARRSTAPATSSTPSSAPTLSRKPDGERVTYSSRYDAVYLDADRVKSPDTDELRATIDQGVSPVITLDWKFGPFTRAEIAAWGPDVQAYFTTYVAGLRRLSERAASRHDDTAVYFADEHEPVVKINQRKYDFAGYGAAGVPTVAESAAAWNAVMRFVARSAPDVVRVYWYGGSAGEQEDAFAAALDPELIEMATFDPYRWRYNVSTDTAQQLWGDRVDHLKSQPWMRNPDGSLKPWGLTEWGTDVVHGDEANARFVTETVAYLRSQGAAFAIYFDRVDSRDSSHDFVITDGRQPKTLQAFRATLTRQGQPSR